MFLDAHRHTSPPPWVKRRTLRCARAVISRQWMWKTRHTIFGVTRWRSPNSRLARFRSFTPNICKRRFYVGWFILRSVNSRINTIKWTFAYDRRRLQVVSNKSIRDTYRPIDTTPCPPKHYQRMSARPQITQRRTDICIPERIRTLSTLTRLHSTTMRTKTVQWIAWCPLHMHNFINDRNIYTRFRYVTTR